MFKATGWETQADDHPSISLTNSREVITISPSAQTISAAIQRPSVVKYAADAATARRILRQGF